MPRQVQPYAFVLQATWTLAGVVLVTAYGAIAIHTHNAWPWREVVHESGERTLIETVLYFEHAARELPLDLLLGAAVGGSVLFAFPGREGTPGVPDTGRRRILATGLLVVVGAIVGGTLWVGGTGMLLDNLSQLHTRPDAAAVWGAHWRYHLLSRMTLMLCSLGLAGIVVLLSKGKSGAGDKGGLLIVGAVLALFGALTIMFSVNLDPFVEPVYLGHQVREVVTHVLIAIPAAWGACLVLADSQSDVCQSRAARVHWPVVAGLCATLIGVFLLVGGLVTSAASQGQTQNLTLLWGPHVFEHMFTYLVVALTAALVYESAVVGRMPN